MLPNAYFVTMLHNLIAIIFHFVAGGACSLRSFVTFSAAGSSLLWLALLAVVVLLALCSSWLLLAWGADALLGRVSQ
jgi:hypothetical protein